MKKLFVLVAALAVMTTGALAADDTPVQVAHMPNMAQEFIGQHFGDVQVSYATMDDGLRKSYDVVLVNGTKLEFDGNGNWTEVDCKHGVVPEAIVPAQIRKYVADNHPGQRIEQIERSARGWEVGLGNGLDLKFNKSFRLMDLDD